MALPKVYSAGTITVALGETVVTGTGTGWNGAVKQYDVLRKNGLAVMVASVESNGSLTLAEPSPWDLTDATYQIAITYDGPEFQLKSRQVWAQINELQALGIQPNAFGVGADRDEFDGRKTGFIFLDLGDPWTLYAKETDADADWSAGQSLEGLKGDPGNIDSSNDTVTDIITISQAAYDALSPPDETTLYIIIED